MSETGCAYTVGTGRLFAPMAEFHAYAEALLARPIFTHEFGFSETWTQLREALEASLLASVDGRTTTEGGCLR